MASDMMMTGDHGMIEEFMKIIDKKTGGRYAIRDLGTPKNFLGMEIDRSEDG